jgi:hypothetical protein
MENEPLKPILESKNPKKRVPRGRLADLVAAYLAVLAALLAISAAILFFVGFVANDAVGGELVSALLFSILLSAFAIIPALLIARLAIKGYKDGLTRRAAAWSIFLSLPWVFLSLTVLTQAPLSPYIAAIALVLASLLCLWAIISLVMPPSPKVLTSHASEDV